MAKLLELEVRVAGGEEAGRALLQAGSRLRERVKEAVLRSALDVEERVAADALSGSVLRVRAGKARGSMTHSVRERENGIGVDVYNKAARGRARYVFMLAAGSHHVARVKAYERRNKPADVKARVARNGKIRKRIVSKGYVKVKAHKRVIRLEPRPVFRSFQAMKDSIHARITAAVDDGMTQIRAENAGLSGGEGI